MISRCTINLQKLMHYIVKSLNIISREMQDIVKTFGAIFLIGNPNFDINGHVLKHTFNLC